jgi:hypothetical protein
VLKQLNELYHKCTVLENEKLSCVQKIDQLIEEEKKLNENIKNVEMENLKFHTENKKVEHQIKLKEVEHQEKCKYYEEFIEVLKKENSRA